MRATIECYFVSWATRELAGTLKGLGSNKRKLAATRESWQQQEKAGSNTRVLTEMRAGSNQSGDRAATRELAEVRGSLSSMMRACSTQALTER